MSERDGFVPRSTVVDGLPPRTEVELTEVDGMLKVLLVVQRVPEWASSGLDLAWRPAAVALRPRQTLRWQINHRFRAEQGWYYRLDTLNVSYGKNSAEVFIHPPTRRIDERSQLP
ncbi:hypothetical protein [Actinomadura sp. K4S16]|nr:hypothetical protein [Actinomadura sp. K4S16]